MQGEMELTPANEAGPVICSSTDRRAAVYDGEKFPVKFTVKDSGKRQQFDSGMVRDTTDGKIDYYRVFDGPMLQRWAELLTRGAVKYPDVRPGVPNWTLAAGEAELARFKASAVRHFVQWLQGDIDEDHAAAVIFNLNGFEYVSDRMCAEAMRDPDFM